MHSNSQSTVCKAHDLVLWYWYLDVIKEGGRCPRSREHVEYRACVTEHVAGKPRTIDVAGYSYFLNILNYSIPHFIFWPALALFTVDWTFVELPPLPIGCQWPTGWILGNIVVWQHWQHCIGFQKYHISDYFNIFQSSKVRFFAHLLFSRYWSHK